MSRRMARQVGLGLVGLVAVLGLDQLLTLPSGTSTLAFTVGYLAALVVLTGRATSWWALPAAVLVGGVEVWRDGTDDLVPVLAAAATTVLAGLGAGSVLRAWSVRISRAVDPVLIALAGAGAAAVVVAGQLLSGALPPDLTAVATARGLAIVLGFLLLVPLLLAARAPGPRMRGGIVVVAAIMVILFATASVPAAQQWVAGLPVGVLAWAMLPLLLAVGWRYGVFATALVLWLLALAFSFSMLRSGLADGAVLVQRQGVAFGLSLASLSVVVLVQRQQRALRRLQAAEGVTAAFLDHAQPVWYIKRRGPQGWVYEQIGGGLYRGAAPQPGITDRDLYGALIAEQLQAADEEVWHRNEGSVTTEELPAPDGQTWTVLSDRFPIRDRNGQVTGIGGLRTDISARAEQEARLQAQNELLRAMFARSPVPTMRVRSSPDGQFIVAAANDALERLTGSNGASLAGSDVADLVADEHRDLVSGLFDLRSSRWSPQAEVRWHTRIGTDRRVVITVAGLPGHPSDPDTGAPVDYLVHVEDVTARRAAEDAVAWYSLFDSMTGLLNRTAFSDRIDGALHRLAPDGALALIVLDIDELKSVNDAHGHAVGDTVLAEFAERIRATCGHGEAAARLGADEFAVLLEHQSHESVAVMVGRLQGALTVPIQVPGGDEIALTTSFGAAVNGNAALAAGELVRQAELALYRAKRGGRGGVEFYAESMRAQEQAVLNVRRELARALAEDSFVVAYQPIVELATGDTCGYEALIRLPTQDGTMLLPGDFLAVARSSGFLPQMDRQVLRRALHDLAIAALPVASAGVSVNAEPDDLRDPDFAMTVLTQLHAHDVDPAALTVEVTEAALLQVEDDVVTNIATLREAGVIFAVDDFGTGYSSLAQLRQLNADVIKIDRSFVSAMDDDPEAANIVATILSLARQLDLIAVAEGIETREQAETLQRLGCDRGQGYLFGRPEPLAGAVPVPRQAGTDATPGARNR